MAGYNSVTLNVGVGGSAVKVYTDSGSLVSEAVIIQTQSGVSDPQAVGINNPLPVGGNVGDLTADAGNSVKVAGVYNTVAPVVTSGQRVPFQTDSSGRLIVNVGAGGAVGGTSSTVGSATPGVATLVGASDGANMRAVLVDGSGNLKVNVAAGGVPAGQDNSSFTAGNTQGLPFLAVADNTNAVSAVTQGNEGALKMTTARQLRVVVDGSSSGGDSFYNAIQPATPANIVIKASAGQIGSVHATNNNATPVYLKLFNLATGSVTPGTTAATMNLEIPGNTTGAGFNIGIPRGWAFGTAITAFVSGAIGATDNTVIAANSVILTIGYT